MKKETYRKIVSLYNEGIGESTAVLCILQSVLGNSTMEFREASKVIETFYHEVIIPKHINLYKQEPLEVFK